ncbi:hypothetical protein [Frigidibacter sp. MR17.14]|uniref:hypothetical protein n=1 Tax=Frigidibacter sp. MR17.14 TaxID=3126509 RepID=UPI0030131C90
MMLEASGGREKLGIDHAQVIEKTLQPQPLDLTKVSAANAEAAALVMSPAMRGPPQAASE